MINSKQKYSPEGWLLVQSTEFRGSHVAVAPLPGKAARRTILPYLPSCLYIHLMGRNHAAPRPLPPYPQPGGCAPVTA